MADPRLEAIAADARQCGWAVEWHDTTARVELEVCPTLSNPEHQGFIGLGFGVTLGGSAVACWVWEAWSGSLIDPWQQSGPAGGPMFQEIPLEQELQRFHLVESLDQALPVFDRAVCRYMALMRRMVLEMETGGLNTWADLEPIAGGRHE
ncbi:hypothetical protein [Synechococcus sp. LA31]|uniref:hypothetical protein n=1 Tax=Synechococcus sp. LA31 TaxID=2741953 RepID=UPI001BDDA892|nr:hypothetical protein [Synechococcus sp. LA31]QVV66782.1 hypothetical protein KJJ24_09825 [Synechococcus sp. LA31]